jgi:hypothetical protein
MMLLGKENLDDFITDLALRYKAYCHKKNAEFQRVWNQSFDELSLLEAGKKAQAAGGVEVYDELQRAIDELCAFYLSVSSTQREHIRLAVGPHRELRHGLLEHVGWASRQIQSGAGEEWVCRGLAAASIEDNRLDYRDMYIALGTLYVRAANAGIDVSRCLQSVAALSNPQPGLWPKQGSMQHFLENFERSAFFQVDVKRQLRQRSASGHF